MPGEVAIGSWLVGGGASDAADALFGNKDKPGAFGTGQYRFTPQAINGEAFVDPNYQVNTQNLQTRQAGIDQRRAPTTQATTIGKMSTVDAARLGQTSTVNAANIGRAREIQGQQIDPAALGQAASMRNAGWNAASANAAEIQRAEDAQWRAGQLRLANALEQSANGQGPSVAESQLKSATEKNLASQVAAAASARGGSSAALAQRGLANQSAALNQEAGRQAAEMRVKEQQDARAQLIGLQQSARGQDISVADSQAQMRQQANIQNAGWMQDANRSNAELLQQANLQNAQLGQQMTLANMDAINNRALQQAQLYQQANLSNQDAFNNFLLQQAQLNQQASLYNAGALNDANFKQADLYQQANMYNADALNKRTLTQADLDQQRRLADVQAYLSNQQMNDGMTQFYQDSMLDLDAQQMKYKQDYELMKMQQDLAAGQINAGAYSDAAARQGAMTGALVGAGGGALAAAVSDERSKKNIKPLDDYKTGSLIDERYDEEGYNKKEKEEYDVKKSFYDRLNSISKGAYVPVVGADGKARSGFGTGLAQGLQMFNNKPEAPTKKPGMALGKQNTKLDLSKSAGAANPTGSVASNSVSEMSDGKSKTGVGSGGVALRKFFKDYDDSMTNELLDMSNGQAGSTGQWRNPSWDVEAPGGGQDVRATAQMHSDAATFFGRNPSPMQGGINKTVPGKMVGAALGSISDENQKNVLGGGAQATQNFLQSVGSSSNNNGFLAAMANANKATASSSGSNFGPNPIPTDNAPVMQMPRQNAEMSQFRAYGQSGNQGLSQANMVNSNANMSAFNVNYGMNRRPQGMNMSNAPTYSNPQFDAAAQAQREMFATGRGSPVQPQGMNMSNAPTYSNPQFDAAAQAQREMFATGGMAPQQNQGFYNALAATQNAYTQQAFAQKSPFASYWSGGGLMMPQQTYGQAGYLNYGGGGSAGGWTNTSGGSAGGYTNTNYDQQALNMSLRMPSREQPMWNPTPGPTYDKIAYQQQRTAQIDAAAQAQQAMLASFGMSMSDEESKKNIKKEPTAKEILKDLTAEEDKGGSDVLRGVEQGDILSMQKNKAFLDKLNAYQYEYKNPEMPGAGYGQYVSPMAQELEKSELGKNMVTEDPATGYKTVDYGKGFGTMLAGQALLNKRLNRLEKKVK